MIGKGHPGKEYAHKGAVKKRCCHRTRKCTHKLRVAGKAPHTPIHAKAPEKADGENGIHRDGGIVCMQNVAGDM